MRGAPLTCPHVLVCIGIITADAGSTPAESVSDYNNWDHPRGCGEHNDDQVYRTAPVGSSPRMRGAHVGSIGLCANLGIIPADAGSTMTSSPFHSSIRDHPRGCGEHSTPRGRSASFSGSSPRMRGAHTTNGPYYASMGIIPADAGSTCWRSTPSTCPWDHPRGCGEHLAAKAQQENRDGSSPRMRGAHLLIVLPLIDVRIIPADAGSTLWTTFSLLQT